MAAALLAAVILLGGQWSGDAAEGPYPGLPDHSGQNSIWAGVAQTAMAETAKARQWARMPLQVAAAFSQISQKRSPADSPIDHTVTTTNYVYLVAPPGSDVNYGAGAPFGVRTVAFGAIPVEAEVQLVQRRRNDGLPEPIMMTQSDSTYRVPPAGSNLTVKTEDAVIKDVLGVRITRLAVDGVDLSLRGTCQTARFGKLSLLGKGFWRLDPQVDAQRPWRTGHYVATKGGLLTGSIDIPPFAGCVTAGGEDMSRLVSAAISGPDNTIRLNISGTECGTIGPNGQPLPPAPGQTTPQAAHCTPEMMPPELPFPERTSSP
jgi:hypothetical protein